jgi:UDP-N-acetyl-D-glucosamine dehydrogenase
MTTRFIELAGEINASMPEYVLRRLADSLNDAGKAVKGSKIALLGVAYKRDIDDPRESPSFVLLEGLLARGAVVTYNDPHVPRLPRMRAHNLPPMVSQSLSAEYLAGQDCVLIATDHGAYDYEFIVRHARLVMDTRNATAGVSSDREKIVKA